LTSLYQKLVPVTFLRGKALPVRKADNLTAVREAIV
jgi:hypothetical protein